MVRCSQIVRSYPNTGSLLKENIFKARSVEALMSDRKASGHDMKRCLGPLGLTCLGVGAIIGAGIFVITGTVAQATAGPAVCLSFVVGGLCAILSSLIYAEFSTELPVAGSSFSYVLASLGQFPAYLTTANLIMEYILSGAAIARGWSSYLATLCGQDSSRFRIDVGWAQLDFLAVFIILALTALICFSTGESSRINTILVITKLCVIVFVIIAGFVHATPSNFTTNFAPFGLKGIFNGAAIIFFAYIGYDALATMAEETKNPGRDLPIGIIGATSFCTAIYIIMCVVICMMVPYDQIDANAPFSTAFSQVGMNWAQYLVAAGALVGITTALLVVLLGQSRIFTMMAREALIPRVLARVSRRYQTPVIAQCMLGAATAIIAFFTDLPILANMVSIGTLFAFFMVATGLLFFRLYDRVNSTRGHLVNTLCHIGAIFLVSLGIAIYYPLTNDWYGIVAFIVLWIIATASMHIFCKQARSPTTFGVPLFPWVPSASMILNAFLLSTLDKDSYIRFGIWSAIVIVFYLLFSLHSMTIVRREEAETLPGYIPEGKKDKLGEHVPPAAVDGEAPAADGKAPAVDDGAVHPKASEV